MGRCYNALLAGLEGLELPPASAAYAESIYWVYGIVLGASIAVDAAALMRTLATLGVGCRPFFCPMHLQPVLRRRGLFAGERYPVAERLYQRGLYLPSGLALTRAQMEHVADAVRTALRP
jgi:perosamine synthetase